jgi:hypothetical protein
VSEGGALMSDLEALRMLIERRVKYLANRYKPLLAEVRAVVPDTDLADMGSFHLLRLATALRCTQGWGRKRRMLNDLLAVAGNPERLPDLLTTYVAPPKVVKSKRRK